MSTFEIRGVCNVEEKSKRTWSNALYTRAALADVIGISFAEMEPDTTKKKEWNRYGVEAYKSWYTPHTLHTVILDNFDC